MGKRGGEQKESQGDFASCVEFWQKLVSLVELLVASFGVVWDFMHSSVLVVSLEDTGFIVPNKRAA